MKKRKTLVERQNEVLLFLAERNASGVKVRLDSPVGSSSTWSSLVDASLVEIEEGLIANGWKLTPKGAERVQALKESK